MVIISYGPIEYRNVKLIKVYMLENYYIFAKMYWKNGENYSFCNLFQKLLHIFLPVIFVRDLQSFLFNLDFCLIKILAK